jgi:hypothetical protein
MAPKPIEDILELLRVLWTFVSDIFVLPWSSFCAKWTYPPFEKFRNERPSLWDQILKLPLALWTFISNLRILLLPYVSKAFWASWTYPPFETFRNGLVAALIYLKDCGPSSHLNVYD